MSLPIRRAGLISRTQLVAARPTLLELASWLEARDVTPLEWARDFPDQGWVNSAAVAVVEEALRR